VEATISGPRTIAADSESGTMNVGRRSTVGDLQNLA
jgi:hypothetical protein